VPQRSYGPARITVEVFDNSKLHEINLGVKYADLVSLLELLYFTAQTTE